MVAGDFDTAQAKKWVEKYFGEIKRGAPVEPLAEHERPLNVVLFGQVELAERYKPGYVRKGVRARITAIMLLGNMAMSAYVLLQLARLRADEPIENLLLRRKA